MKSGVRLLTSGAQLIMIHGTLELANDANWVRSRF